MNIDKQLKEARKSANLTQDDVEKITGINKKTVSNWENGVSRPDVDNLSILCKLYKINPNSIFQWGDGEEEDDEDIDLLIKEAKKLSKADMKKAIDIIKTLRR